MGRQGSIFFLSSPCGAREAVKHDKVIYFCNKNVLRNDEDDYEWNNNILLLNTITKACKVTNDQYRERLPIKRHLLEVILFELGRIFSMQPYLLITHRTLFVLAYYGLFRIGELSKGDHPIKACDVHVAVNKLKILIYLRSSKTHGLESPPQKIKNLRGN